LKNKEKAANMTAEPIIFRNFAPAFWKMKKLKYKKDEF